MKKVLFVLAFLALCWTLKAECPPEVEDYTFTDCYGVTYNLFELLDGGQYVLVEFCEAPYYIDDTRLKEVYHRYGCNGREMFVMLLWTTIDDEYGLSWLVDQGVESPLVTSSGGAQQFFNLYRDCMEIPRYLLINPNHEIYRESITYTNMYGVFDSLGIMPADCNFGECKAPTNLRADLGDTELRLSWTNVDEALYYHVYNRRFEPLTDTTDYLLMDVHDTTCLIDFSPRYGGDYFVVSHCIDGSECASDIVSVPPTAFDFTGTDCHGEEIHLFDILDRGQYVLIDFFFYSCSGCRLQEPNIVESYYRFGCNEEDIFYIGVDPYEDVGLCMQWCEEFDVKFPIISGFRGGREIAEQYHIMGYPEFLLIAPDHSVVYTHSDYPFEYQFSFTDLQSVIDAYEAIGIEEHLCYDGVDESNEQNVNLFPNPADDFVNLFVKGSSVIRVYNAMGQLMDAFVAENQQVKIETSHYPVGLYFVQVDGKGFVKFMVRH